MSPKPFTVGTRIAEKNNPPVRCTVIAVLLETIPDPDIIIQVQLQPPHSPLVLERRGAPLYPLYPQSPSPPPSCTIPAKLTGMWTPYHGKLMDDR